MNNICFNAYYGDEIKRVELSYNEWGGGGHQVYINKGFYGELHYRVDRWIFHSNTNLLTSDDIQILGEIIEMNIKKAA